MKIQACSSCDGIGTIKYSPSGDACEMDTSCPICHGNKNYRILKFKDPITGKSARVELGNIKIME